MQTGRSALTAAPASSRRVHNLIDSGPASRRGLSFLPQAYSPRLYFLWGDFRGIRIRADVSPAIFIEGSLQLSELCMGFPSASTARSPRRRPRTARNRHFPICFGATLATRLQNLYITRSTATIGQQSCSETLAHSSASIFRGISNILLSREEVGAPIDRGARSHPNRAAARHLATFCGYAESSQLDASFDYGGESRWILGSFTLTCSKCSCSSSPANAAASPRLPR
jgi:hypothetical protein